MKAEYKTRLEKCKVTVDGEDFVYYEEATGILEEIESELVSVLGCIEDLKLKLW